MPEPTWGTDGSAPEPDAEPVRPIEPVTPVDRAGPRPRRPRVEEPVPDWLRSTPDPSDVPPGRDPVAVVAVACGFAGIVVAGILFAIVTAILGGLAGQRARESGRTFELPYLAFLLAFVDGAVWIVLHFLLDIPAWLG